MPAGRPRDAAPTHFAIVKPSLRRQTNLLGTKLLDKVQR
jgi:hypothetical protein